MNALNYARMPGPGDLWHAPDDEPEFGLDDAEGNVAAYLAKKDEVGDLVNDLAEARALLNWIASNVDLPANLLPRFRLLDAQSKRMRQLVDAEYAALNGGEA